MRGALFQCQRASEDLGFGKAALFSNRVQGRDVFGRQVDSNLDFLCGSRGHRCRCLCLLLWPVGRRARGAFGLASRVIPSHLPRQLLGNAAGTVGLPARANLGI